MKGPLAYLPQKALHLGVRVSPELFPEKLTGLLPLPLLQEGLGQGEAGQGITRFYRQDPSGEELRLLGPSQGQDHLRQAPAGVQVSGVLGQDLAVARLRLAVALHVVEEPGVAHPDVGAVQEGQGFLVKGLGLGMAALEVEGEGELPNRLGVVGEGRDRPARLR